MKKTNEPAQHGAVHAEQNENKSIIYNFFFNFDTFFHTGGTSSGAGRRRHQWPAREPFQPV